MKKTAIKTPKRLMDSRKGTAIPISLEKYNKEIEEAMEEVKKGQVFSHEEVVKLARGWYMSKGKVSRAGT